MSLCWRMIGPARAGVAGSARRHSLAAIAAAIAIVTAIAPAPAAAATADAGVTSARAPVADSATALLARRTFPLFDAIGRTPPALERLIAMPDVAAMLAERAARRAPCAQDLGCLAQALVWTPAEAAALGAAIARTPAIPATADDGPAAQAAREIEGVNVVLRTFGLGQVPRYPQIDGTGTVDPLELRARLQAADWLSRTPRAQSTQAIDPSIEFALALLDVSDRTDAVGFEPLVGGLNAPAARRAHGLDWRRWRYSAMIVTGVGPETPDMALSPFGKYHLRLAAERFARGDVPFIIVSGGRAHPRATRFTEAEQMRAALIARYAIPADAILIEPYARHTTTNLRNATRLLGAIGAPLDKDTLIVCNPGQSATIASAAFVQRNLTELGYAPGVVGRRLAPTELEFRPAAASLRVDPRDPLDP